MVTWIAGFIILIAKLGVVLLVLLLLAAYLVWLERKFLARLQIRYGPNRAGKFGLLQPIADTIKMLTKEDIVPAAADRFIFLLAPAVVATTALMMFAVVPFGSSLTLFGEKVPLVISDLNVGLLYVFALSSLGVYGVAMGGWASNSKYSLLGGIRGAAQMISYELALGLSLVPIVMLADSFSIVEIVKAQEKYPFILVQPFAFVIFMISAMAESKRIPLICQRPKTNWGPATTPNTVEYASGFSFWVNMCTCRCWVRWWPFFSWAAGGAPFCRRRHGF
jgi:NADH-quinone oxidoreductase subunit H